MELGKIKAESGGVCFKQLDCLEANLWKHIYRKETMTAIISLIVIFNI